MAETVFIVEPINLDSLREAIAALSGDQRFAAVDFWSRVNDQLGRGPSGWLGHFVDQRIGELRGVRRVELGPVVMLSPFEVREIGALCRSMVDSPLLGKVSATRYWSEIGLVFSDRAVRPSAAELSFTAETRRSVHAPRHGTAREVAPPRPPEESKSNPEGGNRG